MAHAPTHDEVVTDQDVRDSVMILRRQRTTKLATALGIIVLAFAAVSAAVYLAYNDSPESSTVPAETR